MRFAALLLVVLFLPGCAGLAGLAIAVDVAASAVGVYQRYEDRTTQKDQNAKIEALKEEIKAHRLRPAAAYLCRHGVLVMDHQPWNGTICTPVAE